MKIQVEGESGTVSEVEAALRDLGYEPVPPGHEAAALRAWVSIDGSALPSVLPDDGPLLVLTDREDPQAIRQLLRAGASDWLLWPRDRKLLGERLAVMRRRQGAGAILAASLAHEINNPLTYVLANLEHVQSTLPSVCLEAGPHPILDAIHGVEQIRSILEDVRSYTQRRETSVDAIELTPVIETTVRILADTLHRKATIHYELETVPRVCGNEAHLRQVLLNLLSNAIQALPDRPREENRITVATRRHPDGVALEVIDNGEGIDQKMLPRIFDAFFTTKKAHQGTGLGLPISTRLVMAMGGRIEAESVPGQGTTFRVILEASQEIPESSRARLLLLEDEPLVVSLLDRLLSDTYEIEATDDARMALAWLEAGRTYDVILSDVMLPGLSGMEFFRQLEKLHPELVPHTGFITGGAFTEEAQRFLATHSARVLEKPFTTASLKGFVARLFGNERLASQGPGPQ